MACGGVGRDRDRRAPSIEELARRVAPLPSLLLRIGHLFQHCVFGFGLLENWNFRVGVLPRCKEILIRRAGFGCVSLQRIGAAEAQMRQGPYGVVTDETAIV